MCWYWKDEATKLTWYNKEFIYELDNTTLIAIFRVFNKYFCKMTIAMIITV